ncbi:hypothetical protein BV898_05355 [Hypsibius exemplaris]|uniref:Uncharacterized protein n=1 Tax=Hypsibius exemplaris TaxID=2072580 RepID=A0A1W0X038_HYPEX|nr:hypothetical protein BV898_05355 [Hypsibius exemplaris]
MFPFELINSLKLPLFVISFLLLFISTVTCQTTQSRLNTTTSTTPKSTTSGVLDKDDDNNGLTDNSQWNPYSFDPYYYYSHGYYGYGLDQYYGPSSFRRPVHHRHRHREQGGAHSRAPKPLRPAVAVPHGGTPHTRIPTEHVRPVANVVHRPKNPRRPAGGAPTKNARVHAAPKNNAARQVARSHVAHQQYFGFGRRGGGSPAARPAVSHSGRGGGGGRRQRSV